MIKYDCIFCKIANKEIVSEIIYEDKNSLAFLDIHPITLGHAMVIPKIHAENILKLPNKIIGPLFSAVQKTVKILSNSLLPDGFTIGINHGKNAGQAIDHIHIHVLPRFRSDGGGSIHTIVKNPPKKSIKEVAKKIRNF